MAGAVYTFTFGRQRSPQLSSPTYEFRCVSEGTWNVRATVRLPEPASRSLTSQPVQVVVQPSLITVPAEGGSHWDWLVWFVPSGVLLGALALSFRRVSQKRRKREQAQLKARLRLERHPDAGRQSVIPDPGEVCRTELILQPRLDAGRQAVEGLSIAAER